MRKRRINPAKEIRNEFRKRIRVARTEDISHGNEHLNVQNDELQHEINNTYEAMDSLEDLRNEASDVFGGLGINNDKMLYNAATVTTKEACRRLLHIFM